MSEGTLHGCWGYGRQTLSTDHKGAGRTRPCGNPFRLPATRWPTGSATSVPSKGVYKQRGSTRYSNRYCRLIGVIICHPDLSLDLYQAEINWYIYQFSKLHPTLLSLSHLDFLTLRCNIFACEFANSPRLEKRLGDALCLFCAFC